MRKPTICVYAKTKTQISFAVYREADQRLCFRYLDSTILPLLKSKISSFLPDSVTVQAGLCRACLENTLLVFPRGGSNHIIFLLVSAGRVFHCIYKKEFLLYCNIILLKSCMDHRGKSNGTSCAVLMGRWYTIT